jgi:murein DD-endopeptidase MepM/ murein hydrolase activator NlpD
MQGETILSNLYATHQRVVVHVVALFALIAAALGSASPAAAAAYPTVSIGQSGSNVSTIQYLLRHRGCSVPATGTFGPTTESQVKAFQRTIPTQDNGVVGSITWPKLIVQLDYGAQGEAVKALQVQLRKHGYQVLVDGSYASYTRTAVVNFKQKVGLSSSSLVGPQTWQALVGRGSASPGSGTVRSGYVLPLAKSALPRWRYERPHHDYPGSDLPVWTGNRVYAMRGGTVSYFGDTCGLGIVITADDGALYRYCHFDSRAVAAGTRVQTGQFIGYSGNTGNSTGPHLHLDIRYGGAYRCPQRMLLALYDGVAVPHPSALPTSGCTFQPNW